MSASTRQAAMSEPWPPAFIRTAPPIEPGTPTAHSKPREPARGDARASDGSAIAAAGAHHPSHGVRRRRSAISIADQVDRRRRRCPGSPSSATSMFEPRPTTSTGRPDACTRLGDEDEVVDRAGRDEQCRRPADPVGGQRAERHVGRRRGRPSAERAATSPASVVNGRRVRRRRRAFSARRRGRTAGDHLVGQRGDVAAAHRDAHVARSRSLAGQERRSGRRAAAARPRGRRGGRRARRRRRACR